MRSMFTMSDLLAGKWLKCQADEPNATAQKELKMKQQWFIQQQSFRKL